MRLRINELRIKTFSFSSAFFIFILLSVTLNLSGCASLSNSPKASKKEQARLYVEVANASIIDHDPTGALENLFKAEELDSSLPELHHSKALAYLQRNDLDIAIEEAKKAVELMPNYSDANNTLGKLYIDASLYKEASEPLLKAAKDPLYREAYKAYTNLGILNYRQNEFSKSLYFLEKAISTSPANACIAYYYRGHLNLREAKFNEAIRDYELATQKFCAGFADAHLALGITYEKNKKFDQARKKFLEIQERYPSTKVAEQAMMHLRYLP